MKLCVLKRERTFSIQVGSIQNPAAPATGPARVVVANGIIAAIELVDENQLSLPPALNQCRHYDFRKYTLCPGLIDCHVHLALDGIDFFAAQARWQQPDALQDYLRHNLEQTLAAGIVLIRDGGDSHQVTLNFKHNLPENHLPYILSPGEAIHVRGKYGSFLGRGVQNRWEMIEQLDILSQRGIDFVKVLVTGIVSFNEYGKIGDVQFTQDDLAFLVTEAHSRGLQVMAHANGDLGVQQAIAARVDSIEHGYFMSQDTIKRLADSHIAWVPTVTPVAVQLSPEKKSAWSEAQRNIIEKTYLKQLDTIACAHQEKVLLGIGTDAGSAGVLHGNALHFELDLFRQAGLIDSDIFSIVTRNGAIITNQRENFGSVEKGKLPAMLLVADNPCTNLKTLAEPMVMFLPE